METKHKRILVLVLILLCSSVVGQIPLLKNPAYLANLKTTAASGGGGGTSFSDDFNRANSTDIGANWTEVEGNFQIVGNTLATVNGVSWINNVAIYSATACTSVDQYIKVSISVNNDGNYFPWVFFRYSNASSVFYGIELDTQGQVITWQHFDNSDTAPPTTIDTVAATIGNTDTWGFTCEGTGSSTVIRGWRNPTANAPGSMSLWDGAGPTFSITTDPDANAVDSGTFLGLGGAHNASFSLVFDNFFGGNL